MSKHERREFFDRLVDLRERYVAARHEATRMTVDDAIEYASAMLERAEEAAPAEDRPKAA